MTPLHSHRIEIKGAKARRNFFNIRYYPEYSNNGGQVQLNKRGNNGSSTGEDSEVSTCIHC